jgi:hypothetical protein
MKARAAIALAAALLVVFPAAAQDGGAPTVTTIPERPSETDDVVLHVTGVFPSSDYAIVSSKVSPAYMIDPAVTHGANDYEVTASVYYRYGPVGAQVITPYDVRIPLGRFPRFARIKATVAFLTENVSIPGSPWFSRVSYDSFVYVKDPEPPRLAVDPPAPTSADDVRVTTRFYHIAYHIARNTHEVDGNVIRLHQHVRYVGPAISPNNPLSEAVVTHELGALAPGNYTLEWRQSGDGIAEQVVATLPFTVASAGACTTCPSHNAKLPLDRNSISYDGIPLGERAGFETVTLGPTPSPFQGEQFPPDWITLQRIWTSNGDYVVSHNCPMSPALLLSSATCAIDVYYNPTLRGDSPGRLFVRFTDYTGQPQTTSMALAGRAMLSRFRTFPPRPFYPDTAVEYYAPALDHYFFTVSPQEQQLVDSGAMGAWQRTGVTFQIGGATDVCRFYGDPVAGPNSHFYTGLAAECDALKALDRATPPGKPAWRYEGIALKSELPQGADASHRPWCSELFGSNPVYRLYNDGADRGIDSNHRFVPSDDLARAMLAKGWIYEGNALCN